MQRIEGEYLIVSCDFCGTDWDGQFPAIEGHRGSIICLECLKTALKELAEQEGVYSCVLCLRERIAAVKPRWSHPSHAQTYACQDCVHQAAGAFDRDPDVPWTWQRV
jgi:hypothetical protein